VGSASVYVSGNSLMLSLLIADDCTVASLGGRLCSGDSDRQESAEVSDESGDPSKDEVCAIEAAVTARSIGHGKSEDDQPCVLEICSFACEPSSGTRGTVLRASLIKEMIFTE
jgi:hypothetical protein